MAAALASAEAAPRRWRSRLPQRLPDLQGKWLTLYTIMWAIMLPIALAGAIRGTYSSLTIVPMWSPYGLHTTDTPEGLRIQSVLNAEARTHAIRAGDYVVAIDGWTLPSSGARAAARTRVIKPDGSATTFRIRRPSGDVYEARLVRNMSYDRQRFRDAGLSWSVAWTTFTAGTLMLPILFIGAAVLLFIRRRREAVPALLSVAFLIYGGIINGADLSGVGARALALASTAADICLFTALLVFPSGRFEPRWTLVPVLLLPVIVVIDPEGAAGSLFGGFFTLSVLAALITRYRRLGEGTERLQLRLAFLGLVIGIVFFMIAIAGNASVAAWQADDPRWIAWQFAFFEVVGTWGLGVMAFGLIVSILRYRLYDADSVIGRSAAYGVLTVGFVALFAASQKFIELFGEEYLGRNMGALAGGIGAAVAAMAIAPMHARAQRWAERRFQKALYRLRHGLPLLVGDLRETARLEQVTGATLDCLLEGVRAIRAALIVADRPVDAREIPVKDVEAWWRNWAPAAHDGIDWDRSDALFPLRVPLEAEGHGRIGWILLGPRPDGSLFGRAECDAIKEIAEPVSRAIEVALQRQQREQQLEIRLLSIEHVIANLSKKIGPRAKPRLA